MVSSLKKGWRRGGKDGEWDTYVIELGGVGVGHVDDVNQALSRGDDESGCMLWKQVDKGRAVREGDGGKGSHVAQVVDLDEGIWELVTASRWGEQERWGEKT